jgi:hypothetical protein
LNIKINKINKIKIVIIIIRMKRRMKRKRSTTIFKMMKILIRINNKIKNSTEALVLIKNK